MDCIDGERVVDMSYGIERKIIWIYILIEISFVTFLLILLVTGSPKLSSIMALMVAAFLIFADLCFIPYLRSNSVDDLYKSYSYSISISGTATNLQSINLKDYDFFVDVGSCKIKIAEKNTEIDTKDMELYEVHINGSDINIENLNLNDFTISIDQENRWIVLTEKE